MSFVDDNCTEVIARPPLKPGGVQRLDAGYNYRVRKTGAVDRLFPCRDNPRRALELVDGLGSPRLSFYAPSALMLTPMRGCGMPVQPELVRVVAAAVAYAMARPPSASPSIAARDISASKKPGSWLNGRSSKGSTRQSCAILTESLLRCDSGVMTRRFRQFSSCRSWRIGMPTCRGPAAMRPCESQNRLSISAAREQLSSVFDGCPEPLSQ
jgi:hypothetical protein